MPVLLTAQSAQKTEVRAVIEQFFRGMHRSDSTMVRKTLHADARLHTSVITAKGELKVSSDPIGDFVGSLAKYPVGALDERLSSLVIEVDDPLATAWTEYTFYFQGKFSHCGVNAFQLVRTPEGWKILQITDTRRREHCDMSVDSLHAFVDRWHQAAATANEDVFFGSMAPTGIYIGTDAGEHWLRDELREWSKEYFARESAWSFKPYDRHLFFSNDGQTAWWDELLDTWMGVCRGSGVAHRTDDGWLIDHYHLSVTIANDKIQKFIDLVKAP